MSLRSWKPLGIAVALVSLCLLLAAASAAAATRFAAPGGTAGAESPCAAANPCSLFNAASETAANTALRAGDEVVVEPGNYSDTAGDLGAQKFVLLAEGIGVHGAAGQPRPVIALDTQVAQAGLIVQSGDTLSDLEIKGTTNRSDVLVEAGRVERVTARSSAPFPYVCEQTGGLIRDSACLSSGNAAKAIGTPQLVLPAPTTVTAKLRNVTAVSTGNSSVGLEYKVFGPSSFTVDGVGVIAKGAVDVVAGGFSLGNHDPGTGAAVAIDLDHSDYAHTEIFNDEARANPFITPLGSPTNITEPPLFAADGIHELVSSPTVDRGASDGESGSVDIDGQQRSLGSAADIGADEFLPLPTTTTLSCTPPNLVVGVGAATCLATVAGANPAPPSGVVKFTSNAQGAFGSGASCTLSPLAGDKASCQLTYTPTAGPAGVGAHRVTASYQGDTGHAQSQAVAQIQATAAPSPIPKPTPGPNPKPIPGPPSTSLTRKPKAKSANRLAKFSFSSDQAASTFQCKLDRGPFRPCHSPFAKKVKPGRHVFRVRAVDPAGLADPSPVVFRWKVS